MLAKREAQHVREQLLLLFVDCQPTTGMVAIGSRLVRDNKGRLRSMRLSTDTVAGHDTTLHGRRIRGTLPPSGGLEVLLDTILMTVEPPLRQALLCLLALIADDAAVAQRLARAQGKAIVFCLTQLLVAAVDDDTKLNSLWLLGTLLQSSPTLQHTVLQHDGATLLLRLCRLRRSVADEDEGGAGSGATRGERRSGERGQDPGVSVAAGSELSEVPGVAAWALGMLCSHNEAAKETIALGGVEALAQLLELRHAQHTHLQHLRVPAHLEIEHTELQQASHAAFALRILLERGGREAVRRCEAVDGLELLLRLSRVPDSKLAVYNAVLGIGLLTQSTRATLLDAPGEEPEEGGRERPSVSGSGDARSDRAEAPSACSSVAERYLRLKEEDWDHAVPQRTYARALVLTAEPEGCSRSERAHSLPTPPPFAGLGTPTPPPPPAVPSLQHARRELRAKLLRDRAKLTTSKTSTFVPVKQVM